MEKTIKNLLIVAIGFFTLSTLGQENKSDKGFMLIFRNAYNPDFKPSPEQIKANIKEWKDWIGGIAGQGKFVSTNRVGFQGNIVSSKGTENGIYKSKNMSIGGYLILKSKSLEEAAKHAEGCPILKLGGSVEVREVMQINP